VKLIDHPVFPTMITIGHRALDATAPVPHDPSSPAPIGDEAGVPDESAIQTALVIIAKGTFAVDDPTGTPAGSQQGLLHADETTGPPDGPITLAESDVAVFKPRTDVIVRGAPEPPAPPEPGATLIGGAWTETVAIGGASMSVSFPIVPVVPMTFGWEMRVEPGPRANHSGRYGPEPFTEFALSGHRLPVGFTNRFFNGGRYGPGGQPVFTHPPAPAADVVVSTTGEFDLPGGAIESVTDAVTLHLPSEYPTATVRYRDAIGRPRASELGMNADTIVYDKAGATFTVTWRANFDFLSVAADRYEAVLVTGGI
jgi:hypothetical protein